MSAKLACGPREELLQSNLAMDRVTDAPDIIPWELLHMMIPNVGLSDPRPASGLLDDGRAYATLNISRNLYFLFSDKQHYIRHFLRHYLAGANVDRLKRPHGYYIPVRRLLGYPRLEAVDTTEKDIRIAATSMHEVALVENADILLVGMADDRWSY